MNRRWAFLRSSGTDGAVKRLMIRGELAIGAQASRHELEFGRSVWTLTLMQTCASAAKLRAAGPFSPSASVPRQQPVPATSDRRPAVPALDASSGRRVGKEMISRRLFSLPDAE